MCVFLNYNVASRHCFMNLYIQELQRCETHANILVTTKTKY